MKFTHLVCLASVVWLTGCATTGTPTANLPDTGSESTGLTAPSVRSFSAYSLKPIIPGGILLPIKAAQVGSDAVAQLSPPADLWDRMRIGFGMPDLENDLVHDREQWYTTRPDYMLRMTERSRKYLFHIIEELEMRNMPTELALLPFIESAFNPLAVSSAKAAGMWQFMPATGRHFELKQNAFRDDRRDVLASTRAALDYLQRLHTLFGDWHLALAAYNWGEGSVGRAIAKNQRAGLGTAYSDLDMPAETRYYVPKLLAMKNIVINPEAFNSRLPLIENHPYFQSVDITRDIDVALAARLAEIPLEDFKALNPAANRPVIFAAGTPQILLPWDNATIFQENLEAHGDGHLASWTVWVAPTTLNPADAARRVGMSESELRSINNIPPRVLIKAGSSLLVTRAKNSDKEVTEHAADNGQLALAPEVLLRRTVLKAGKKDSVTSLAKRYRVSPASVADWNKTSTSAAFKAGQQIVMFLPESARATLPRQASTRGKTSVQQAKNQSVRAKRAVNR